MISPQATISPKANLGKNIEVGPYTIIHDNVEIGDNTKIGSFCEIGIPTDLAENKRLIIGKDSLIRSHSIFYQGSTIGKGLKTGHRVTVREQSDIGIEFQLGTLGDIQGHCKIGDYVRTHSNVHIGQKTTIGNFVWIFPYTVFTNDPHPPSNTLIGATVEDYAVITTMCVVLPGVKIGRHAVVGAHSLVTRNVEPSTIVAGSPAKSLGPTSKIKLKDQPEQSAYPWTQHFHRGYNIKDVEQWIKDNK